MSNPLQILTGDCRETLKTIPDGTVQCCVTSPPYWGLRSYLPTGHDDKHMEIGQEPKPDCGQSATVKLRADLNTDQIAFVLQKLADAGLLYAPSDDNERKA